MVQAASPILLGTDYTIWANHGDRCRGVGPLASTWELSRGKLLPFPAPFTTCRCRVSTVHSVAPAAPAPAPELSLPTLAAFCGMILYSFFLLMSVSCIMLFFAYRFGLSAPYCVWVTPLPTPPVSQSFSHLAQFVLRAYQHVYGRRAKVWYLHTNCIESYPILEWWEDAHPSLFPEPYTRSTEYLSKF